MKRNFSLKLCCISALQALHCISPVPAATAHKASTTPSMGKNSRITLDKTTESDTKQNQAPKTDFEQTSYPCDSETTSTNPIVKHDLSASTVGQDLIMIDNFPALTEEAPVEDWNAI